ncbi:MAG: DUF1572 domain-containing protein [Acidimicrobiia bacterium]|nr:DUF1572 domain-containing protein [Acidimicrobiia bacterium]
MPPGYIIASMDRTLDSTLLHITRIRLLQDYPSQIATCLDLLSEEELWWRPNDKTNAVGNIVVHLAWSNRYYLEQVITGRDIGRTRDAEFAARGGYTKAQVREIWDRSVRAAEEVLNGLEPSQLMQTTDRTGKVTTFAQLLLHVTHHNANHMGQVVWIAKMLHEGGIDELWMKARARPSA